MMIMNGYLLIQLLLELIQHSAGAKNVNSPTADQAIGRSAGGLSTKIHTTCDALMNPTRFHLSPCQVHDLDGADVLENAPGEE